MSTSAASQTAEGARAASASPLRKPLSTVRVPQPLTLVIFGGTGDLARRKLIPALFRLWQEKLLPEAFAVVGVARENMDDEEYRRRAREALGEFATAATEEEWAVFGERLFFGSHVFDDEEGFERLKTQLGEVEGKLGIPGNRLFYYAVPPQVVDEISRDLGKAGLICPPDCPCWTRMIVEKPFGRDLASAQALNALVHKYIDEHQVYRIDHYLGKETVQNLLVFRFANAMFESVWDRDHVESVTITVAEELGVESRAGYYETAGALRDMVQSHLTQLMTLVAMEVPAAMDADSIRAEKLKVLRSVRPLAPTDAVLGQYEPGQIGDRDVPGYREEPGVAPDSRTETFVALTLHLENWRWQGVPFFLRTGKRMPRRLTEIEIKFRRAPVWMFRGGASAPEGPGTELHRNTLLVTLQPNEGFSLYFDVKAPGDPFRIRRLPLHFTYAEEFGDDLPEAYETLVRDVLAGDQTLFVHAAEVEASWALYAPLLDGRRAVYPYPAGSWGPHEAAHVSSRAPAPAATAPMGGV
jgi:glucose-6-phosphate 1-dehydrogenase